MVMPILRLTDNPKFDLIEELIDFVDQILEVPSGKRSTGHSSGSEYIAYQRACSPM